MKAYRIQDDFSYSQKHIVIAKDYDDAEKTYKEKYPNNNIKEIILEADYVQISKEVLKEHESVIGIR